MRAALGGIWVVDALHDPATPEPTPSGYRIGVERWGYPCDVRWGSLHLMDYSLLIGVHKRRFLIDPFEPADPRSTSFSTYIAQMPTSYGRYAPPITVACRPPPHSHVPAPAWGGLGVLPETRIEPRRCRTLRPAHPPRTGSRSERPERVWRMQNPSDHVGRAHASAVQRIAGHAGQLAEREVEELQRGIALPA